MDSEQPAESGTTADTGDAPESQLDETPTETTEGLDAVPAEGDAAVTGDPAGAPSETGEGYEHPGN